MTLQRVAQPLIISPTGKGLRHDISGLGHYGAKRGSQQHDGMDFLCAPGQEIFSPIRGTVVGLSNPHPGSDYSGVLIHGISIAVTLWYFKPRFEVKGLFVEQGHVIGRAQKISDRYPDDPHMLDHVKLKIDSCDPAYFMEMVK